MALDTSISGLTIEFVKHSSYLYAYILHEGSNKRVMAFNNGPLPFGKREFIKRVNESALTEIDWTQGEENLATKDIFDKVLAVRQIILS